MNTDILNKFMSDMNLRRDEVLERVNNTTYYDMLRLRNEAANKGIELTPSEVIDLIMLIKEALS